MRRSFVSRWVGRGAWLVLPLAVAACGDDGTGPVDTAAVTIVDSQFNPEDIVVAPGASVTWTWTGTLEHNVNFASAGIPDGPDQTAGTYTATMPTTPGVYAYLCDFHPGIMTGTVEVQ